MLNQVNIGIVATLGIALYYCGRNNSSFKIHNEIAQIINGYDPHDLRQISVFKLKTNIPENGWICNLTNSAFANSIENLRLKQRLGKVTVKLDNYPYSNRVVIENLNNDIIIHFDD